MKRPYLPGTAFHLAARTIGRQRLLGPLRDDIVGIVADGFTRTDAQLLGYALMRNHFHLIVRQGRVPLSSLMHPICRGIALRAQRFHSREGHIFERRYRAVPCVTPQHLRRAIAYVHRNPVAAGLCTHPSEYEWSSYWAYAGTPALQNAALCGLTVSGQLELFAAAPNRSPDELIADYGRYADWLDYCKRLPLGAELPKAPSVLAGDDYWQHHFRRLSPLLATPRPDLRDLVRQVLREQQPPITLEQLRLTRGGPAITRVRHAIIARAVLANFPGVAVARYLDVAESTVSRVARDLRERLPSLRSRVPEQGAG